MFAFWNAVYDKFLIIWGFLYIWQMSHIKFFPCVKKHVVHIASVLSMYMGLFEYSTPSNWPLVIQVENSCGVEWNAHFWSDH